ncbi:hypothetical protein AAIA72_02025 [Hahella sp. SMD15-11]|uniref:Lipase helper protein n=1 Tax=Thermohahella caldifontis TaxID=3142973 RepID=A0AB39UY00_9GAMM
MKIMRYGSVIAGLGLMLAGSFLVGVSGVGEWLGDNLAANSTPVPERTAQPEPDSQTTGQDRREALRLSLIRRLREDYGTYVNSVAARAELRDLRDSLIKAWPDEGDALFRSVIRGAFPEQAEAILNLIARLDAYDEWVIRELVSLNHMDPLSRQGTLWAKRREMFGDDAEQLWQDELRSREARAQTVQQTVALLNKADETPMEERLYLLRTTLEEQYRNTVEAPLVNAGLVAQVFFRLDSVQNDLKRLPPDARQSRINALRRQMGLTEAQVAALEKQDQQRQKQWETGMAYMEARRALTARYHGQPPAAELDALRRQYFGSNAVTIAREEAQGFFRFERPRLYGRN